jgi:hypothetical protein
MPEPCLGRPALTALLVKVEQYLLDHPPISLHHKHARYRILRRATLTLSDRLLVTVIHHRWKTQHQAFTRLLGSPRGTMRDAIHEMTPVLEGLDQRIPPAPISAPTSRTSPT